MLSDDHRQRIRDQARRWAKHWGLDSQRLESQRCREIAEENLVRAEALDEVIREALKR